MENCESFANFSEGKPSVEELAWKTVNLKPNDTVVISIVLDGKNVFVRPKRAEDTFNLVLQDVALHCSQATPLEREPNFGDLLGAKFGSNYLRAVVVEEVGSKEYKLSFVDYGNIAVVCLKDMFSLPEPLRQVPCSVVRIGLNGVRRNIINLKAWKYLNEVASKKVVYKAVFDQFKLDEVILCSEKGNTLNSNLADIMKTTWEENIETGNMYPSGEKYMIEHLEYEEWEIGSDKVLDVMIYDGESTIVAHDISSENYIFSEQVMKDMMYEYFEKGPMYRPLVFELCITMHEGNVTRAYCSGSKVDDKFPLILLDQCPLVMLRKVESIRQMMPEFMMYPISILVCNIPALKGRSADDKAVNFFKMILKINNKFKCKIISKEEEYYNVDVEEINRYLELSNNEFSNEKNT